jgi:hypothetical protein
MQPIPTLLAGLRHLAANFDEPRYNFAVCQTSSSADIQHMLSTSAENLQQNEAVIRDLRANLDPLVAHSRELTDRVRKLILDLATKQQEELAPASRIHT